MNEFINAAKTGNIQQVKKMLKSRSNSDKWLAAEGAYKNNFPKIVVAILGDEGLVEFKSREFVEIVKGGDMKKVEEWLNDPEVDPASFENSAIKAAFKAGYNDIVYELMELATVREQFFADCKSSLTLEEVRFLLYGFAQKVEDATYLYEQYVDEEQDDEFSGSEDEDSEEDSFDGSESESSSDEEEDDIDELSEVSVKGKRIRKQTSNVYIANSDDDEDSDE